VNEGVYVCVVAFLRLFASILCRIHDVRLAKRRRLIYVLQQSVDYFVFSQYIDAVARVKARQSNIAYRDSAPISDVAPIFKRYRTRPTLVEHHNNGISIVLHES